MTHRGEDGTTLVEVLVAMLVFVTGLMAVAQLFLVAAAANASSRATTMAATLAAQKMEELLSSDVVEVTERAEHLDAWGHVSGTGDTVPANAVYTRRWTIESVSADAVAVRVRAGRSTGGAGPDAMAGEVRIQTIKRRTRS